CSSILSTTWRRHGPSRGARNSPTNASSASSTGSPRRTTRRPAKRNRCSRTSPTTFARSTTDPRVASHNGSLLLGAPEQVGRLDLRRNLAEQRGRVGVLEDFPHVAFDLQITAHRRRDRLTIAIDARRPGFVCAAQSESDVALGGILDDRDFLTAAVLQPDERVDGAVDDVLVELSQEIAALLREFRSDLLVDEVVRRVERNVRELVA